MREHEGGGFRDTCDHILRWLPPSFLAGANVRARVLTADCLLPQHKRRVYVSCY
jgi:hypothetical protein